MTDRPNWATKLREKAEAVAAAQDGLLFDGDQLFAVFMQEATPQKVLWMLDQLEQAANATIDIESAIRTRERWGTSSSGDPGIQDEDWHARYKTGPK